MDQGALDLLLAATEAAEVAEGVDNSTRITSTDTRGLAQTPDLPPTTHYRMSLRPVLVVQSWRGINPRTGKG